MAMMKKKSKKARNCWDDPPASPEIPAASPEIPAASADCLPTIPDTVRKQSYLRALQSDRMAVLVGTSEVPFEVPQDLLAQYSEPFGRMCSPGLNKNYTRTIRLPEVEVPVFEDFLVWIYAFEPSIDASKSLDALIDLAIFGEIYMIHQLKDQTSDAIKPIIAEDNWKPSPDMVSKIYDGVPSGSILRRLCLLGFAIRPRIYHYGQIVSNASIRRYENHSEWKLTFEKIPDFGWDYFQISQTVSQEVLDINSGGPCRFHDHSDKVNWNGDIQDACPSASSWSKVAPHTEQAPGDEVLGEETPLELNDLALKEENEGNEVDG